MGFLAVIGTIALIDEYFGIMITGQEISSYKGMPDLLVLIQSRTIAGLSQEFNEDYTAGLRLALNGVSLAGSVTCLPQVK